MTTIDTIVTPEDQDLVTIVIINYNYAAYLATAIDSALAQDHPAIQTIVVDDGSSDGSRHIIESYGSAVEALYCPNRGHSAALNTGYSRTRGNAVLFLDADDLLHPTCISTALRNLMPGDVKIQFQLETIDPQGVSQAMAFPYFSAAFTPAEVRRQSLLSGWYAWTVSTGNLYRRQYLDAVLPLDDTKIYRSPDGYLNKLAPLFGNVRSLAIPLGAYRVHGRNQWASAAGAWDIAAAVRWLRFESALEDAFLRVAAHRGIAVRRPLLSSFHQLESRILVLRFATDRPLPDDSRRKAIAAALNWLLLLRTDGWAGGIGRLSWLLFLAFAPRDMALAQMRVARAQSGRSLFWRRAVNWTRRL